MSRMSSTTYKTASAADRAARTVPSYYERVATVPHEGGYVLAAWRGPVSRPEDGRLGDPARPDL